MRTIMNKMDEQYDLFESLKNWKSSCFNDKVALLKFYVKKLKNIMD